MSPNLQFTMTPLMCLAALVLVFCAFTSGAAQEPNSPARSARFRAGAATSVITPKLGVSINGHFNDRRATHIHDELHARCLVLDDGHFRVAFAICDSCMIPREIIDAAKSNVQYRTGLEPENILISATHTHTAPTCAGVFQSDADPEYASFLTTRLADGLVRAMNNLAPAKIAWGKGAEPRHVFNRRWKMQPGSIPPDPFGASNDQVKMNPPVGSPHLLEPAGPVDPEIAVLSLISAEGRPLALLANYSLHYVGTGVNDISADYFGIFATKIARLLNVENVEPPFVGMLANGTSGDINNINFRVKRPPATPYQQASVVAHDVAAEVCRVFQTLEHRENVGLNARQAEITLRVRRPSEEDVARAKRIIAEAAGHPLKTSEQVYARETLLLKEYPPEVSLVIQAFRIGDLGIVAIPCEVFAETGLAIKRQSPFLQTFTIELANGYNGYLPTPEQHGLGGYETWRARSSYLEIDAEPKILKTALSLLDYLHNAPQRGSVREL